MLVDGNSLTYRAFFALPTDLMTASGQVTNAVFGFSAMLLNLIRDHRPDRVIIAFDRPEPTFRHERVSSYKANRDSPPDILREQMGLVRQVVETLRLPVVEQAGFEADDLIATLAELAVAHGDDVVIVTGDRDSYQLVRDPHIKVLYNRRGVSDYAMYDEAGILERTGVRPDQYVSYAALRGDPSDNLPGVPKVGEKTAARLVTTYGDLDGIFAHTAEQTPALRKSLEEHEEQARSNAEMMVLLRDVPLPLDPDALDQGEIDPGAVLELFGFLEFPSLVPRLAEAFPSTFGEAAVTVPDAPVLDAEVTVTATRDQAVDALARAAGRHCVAVAGGWTGLPGRSSLAGVSIALDGDPAEVVYLPAGVLGDVADELRAVLCAAPQVIAHDAKPLIRSLLDVGLDLTGLTVDTKLAAYLLDPADTAYSLADLLRRHAGLELAGLEPVGREPVPQGQLDLDVTAVDEARRVGRDALAVLRVAPPIAESLTVHGLSRLNDTVEVPLVRVLARM